jgi:adenylate kinase family enzyme
MPHLCSVLLRLFHGPEWTTRPQFEADVDAATKAAGWVADAVGYPSVVDMLVQRADTFVWLDYSKPRVMARVVRRSLARATYDRELWNGKHTSSSCP